ncbi:helix-turn-helix domain-containing protein [Amniculibacterium aquaticum]|uniref:helix-turn-helix domain-containing protein n=1 Tax=Amniculibacterium aquaticum TaxID=2479858 RepID=UPI001F153CE0|nr:helix-turn-helix transcriptional regulator [Amniculibacterium aquaticum]
MTRKLNSKMELKDILKNAREKKSMLMREVAALIEVDTAMISKFEKGDRNPTRNQVEKLADILELDNNILMKIWLRDKLVNELENEELALEALKMAEKKIKALNKKQQG